MQIVFHAKYVETAMKLNCVKTEVDVMEISIQRPPSKTLPKSWFSQKIAEALVELIIPECQQGAAKSQPHLYYPVKNTAVSSNM